MTDYEFVGHVALHAGLGLDAAALTSHAIVRRLASELRESVRAQLAEELPPQLAAAVAEPGVGVALPIEAYGHLEGLTTSEAREVAITVCRVIAEASSTSLRRALADAFPAIAAFAAGEAEALAPAHPVTRGHTIADGEPGASHPLGSAGPPRGQRASIAGGDDPHGDVKLSSAHGATQEREHETLAEGRPGSPRPVAGR